MPSPGETLLCRYDYDPLDQLIANTSPNVPERQRFYCKSRLATEIQGAMRFSIVQQGEQLLAQQRSEGDASDTTLLATDQQRSVLQTVRVNHPPQSIVYSPYGHRPVGSGLLSLLGFNGERPDRVTGYYLLGNGYRAFNPVLMRFNSPDSWSPFGEGGLNAYMYCSGDPVNFADPTGHFKTGPILKFIQTTRKSIDNAIQQLIDNATRNKSTRRTLNPRNGAQRNIAKNTQLNTHQATTNEIISQPTGQVASDSLNIQHRTLAKRHPNVNTNRTNPAAPVHKEKYSLPPYEQGNLTHSAFRAKNEAHVRMMEMKEAISISARNRADQVQLIRSSISPDDRAPYLIREITLSSSEA
jgi:RHS repeat-associated protein